MGFIGFIILGIIAGAIAKLIIPGKNGGWVSTIVIGIIGAILGGWISGLITGHGLTSFFSLVTWIFAIVGAIIVLLIWGAIQGRRAAA